MDGLSAFQLGEDAVAVFVEADGHNFFSQTKNRTKLPKLKAEALDNLAIAKIKHRRTLVQQGDLDAQRGKHGGVFQPDDASADHDQLARQFLQVVHLVGIEDALAVNGNVRIVRRARAAGKHEVLPTQHGQAVIAGHFHGVRIQETRVAFVNGDAIAAQLRLDDLDFARHHRVGTEDEVLHGDGFFQRVAAPVERALPQAAEVEDGFAKGFAGNGAGVHAHSTDGAFALDDSHFLAQFGGADGGLLSGGTAAHYHQVVGVVAARLGWTRSGAPAVHA